jgi:hypothetical protein
MRMSFRQSVFITPAVLGAIVGLTAMSAIAAPPDATDATTPAPSASSPMRTSPGTSGPAASGTSAGAQDNAQANDSAPATRQSMEAQVEQRIEDLHSKLQITATQEPAWKKFAQTMRDNARKMDQTFEQRIGQMDSMNALDNMKSYARISREHADDVQALLPPFQALYGKMSQSQKQAADQVFREDANRGAAQAQHG